MSAKNRCAMFAVLPAMLILAITAEAGAASFQILWSWSGPPMWPGGSANVGGVSDDGTTLVGSIFCHDDVDSSMHPQRWTAKGEPRAMGIDEGATEEVLEDGTVVVVLPWPPTGAFEGAADDVSADGSVVVGQRHLWNADRSSLRSEPFRWTSEGGVVGLGLLDQGDTHASASAVSADGSIVAGWTSSDSGRRAFRWTQAEGMVALGALPGHQTSYAESVSADGSAIVGTSSSDSAAEAFRWRAEGQMVGLGRLGDHPDSCAQDVSADGSVIVGWSGTGMHGGSYPISGVPGDEAFLWIEGAGMVGLGYLPGHGWSQAYAVSADGSIVVGASARVEDYGEYRRVGTKEAFIWDAEHGMRSLADLLINEYGLELPDWPLGCPTGISADGRVIVGSGGIPLSDPSDWSSVRGGTWVAVIPEPPTIVLAAVGLFGLPIYAWRKRRVA